MGFGDVDGDTPVNILSGGEKTRLALCKLLLETPDLLILDEPTNHLDFKTLLWLEGYLTGYKGALLIVSHDRYFLDRLCTSVWELLHKEISTFPGNYSVYVRLKEERDERYRKEYEAQQQEISELKDFINRNIVRATTSARAKSRRKALERMEVIERPKPPPKPPAIRFEKKRDPVSDILAIEDVSLSVGAAGQEKKLFEHLNLTVKRGEKLAMIGANGVGKTSLLRALLGELPYSGGYIEWGRNVDISYFDQGDDIFDRNKTALDALWDVYPREYEHTVRAALGRVGLTGENVFKPVGLLSGGERARLKFAKLMLSHGNVMILDEPTNHLDLASKEVIDQALTDFDGTLLVVSHDRYLLNKFPDKIIEMHADGAVIYKGRYDQYMEQKQQNQPSSPQPAAKQEKAAPNAGYRSKKQRSEETAQKKRMSELESRIETIEVEIWGLEQEIILPEIAADYLLLQEKCDLLEQKKLELECSLSEWSSLESV
jgi:ATP-binding cassette subfamily F protein 3